MALAKAGNLVLAIGVRGVGETRSAVGREDYYQIYGAETDPNFTSWMIGRPFLGMRGRPLIVRGEGGGGRLALFAAALEETIPGTETHALLASYQTLVGNPGAAVPSERLPATGTVSFRPAQRSRRGC